MALSARLVAIVLLVVLSGLVAACGGGPAPVQGVVRDQRTGRPVAGATVRSGDGSARTDEEGRFRLELAASSRHVLQVRSARHCPRAHELDVPAGGARQVIVHLLEPLAATDDRFDVGFDREVTMEARVRCGRGRVRWTQTAGPRVALRPGERAGSVSFRTLPLERLARLDDRPGVVALSRSERGDYRFRAEADTEVGRRSVSVRVVSAAASTGLFQVPTGAATYLRAGPSVREPRWVVQRRPTKSRAELEALAGGLARLRPDVFGTYQIALVGASEPYSFVVQAGAYEDVPRDCGRQPCHAPEQESFEGTRHASAFRRGLDGALGPRFDVGCWSCHATGVDPGFGIGGLDQTAQRARWRAPTPAPGAFDSMPRRVRRHAQVWCSACHGPGRIVPPESRWQYGAKYGAQVCARCHDAPSPELAGGEHATSDDAPSHSAPRGPSVDPDAAFASDVVREWRGSLMARFVSASRPGQAPALDDPALLPECATCHSAQAFVEWIRRDDRGFEPSSRTVEPVTCAACHDPHDGSRVRALRAYDAPLAQGSEPIPERWGTSAICVTCHRAGGGPPSRRGAAARPSRVIAWAPHAPHTDVLLGTGSRLVPPSNDGVHRDVQNGCVGCHMASPAPQRRGRLGGHTFAVQSADGASLIEACRPCHGEVASFDAVARDGTTALRDWDGDGTAGSIRQEVQRAAERARLALRAAVARVRIADRCPTPRFASDVISRRGELVLVATAEPHPVALGDCDGDGAWRGGEDRVQASPVRLPSATRDAAWDLALIEEDRSSGIHNPTFALRVLAAVARAAR